MYCKNCGHMNSTDSASCTECGILLSSNNLVSVEELRKENNIQEEDNKKNMVRISKAIGFLVMLILVFTVISK